MLTIFSIPKPFSGRINILQRNALSSWLQLRPKCEIILCGSDPTVIRVAREYGVKSLPEIECNEYGTPLLNSVFQQVKSTATYSLRCYVNSDIIFLSDLLPAIERIPFTKFLAIGQRTNLEIEDALEFSNTNWQTELSALTKIKGQLYIKSGMDYFIYTKNSGLDELPPFVVGRPRWDNWFVFNARMLGLPVVDITRVCRAIHQNHDYYHIPHWSGNAWDGPETETNNRLFRKLLGGKKHLSTINDATYILTNRFLLPAVSWHYLYQRLQTTAVYKPIYRPLASFSKSVYKRLQAIKTSH